MKGVFTAIVLLLGISPSMDVLSQNLQLIDSLKHELSGSTGETRFKLLNEVAWEFRFAHPDSTIFYAQQSYDLGRSIGVKNDLARPLNYIGIAHNYNGKRLEAIEFHRKAIDVASEQNDTASVAHAYNSIGRVYFEQGMMQQSVDYYVGAQKIFESINDLSGMAYVYQSLGNLYRTQKDYNRALDFYNRALTLREKLNNKRNLMAANVLVGRLYQEQNQLDMSNKYFLKGYEIGRSLNDEIQLAEIQLFLAQNYLKSNKPDVAESYCLEAYKAVTKINNVRMIPWVSVTLGEIYIVQQKDDKARQHLTNALHAAITFKDAGSQRDAYYWLWKLEEKKKNASQAMKYHNAYLIMRDSTSSLELAREVDMLQFQLEVEKRDKENELLKASEVSNAALIKQQRLENLALILAVVAGITIVILQGINQRKRKKINDQLALQNIEIMLRNEQLSELNNEKDTLMNIMVHDLKSPLNNIKGLTSLVALDGSVNANQQYYLKLIGDSTASGLEMITDLLDAYAIESGEEVSHDEIELQDFLTHRVNAFMKTASEKNVTLELQAEKITITTDKGYLSRILDNLISNAIKFSPQDKSIKVSAMHEKGNVRFSIQDQGQGFSDEDKKHIFQKFKKLSARPTGGESSNGLGLAIVKILVDRLGGNIELISVQGEGSEFVITIPSASIAKPVTPTRNIISSKS
jgi:signal transduction histidine kinase